MNLNSTPVLFRQELRQLPGQHPLFKKTHPFWRDCFRGRLAREDVRRWALDVYPVIRDFPRLYAHVATRCESEQTMTFLAETIFEETGCGVEAESHPALFRTFFQALGVAENDIALAPATAAGQAFWKYAWETAQHGSFLEGLTLVGIGIERPLPDLFQMIARSFQRHFGLDDAAVKFFAVHTVADVKHSQLAARILADLARTSEEQARVRQVVFDLWDLQHRQLDELHQASQCALI